MRSKAAAWGIFLVSLVLVSFAASTCYSKSADFPLISFRLAIVLAMSILVVRQRWTHSGGQGRNSNTDAGDTTLRRFRRWYHDAQND